MKKITRKQVREFCKTLPYNANNKSVAGGCYYMAKTPNHATVQPQRPGCLVGQVGGYFVGMEFVETLPSQQVLDVEWPNSTDYLLVEPWGDVTKSKNRNVTERFRDAGFTKKAIEWLGVAQQFADDHDTPWGECVAHADRVLGLTDAS